MRCIGRRDGCQRDAVTGSDRCGPCNEAWTFPREADDPRNIRIDGLAEGYCNECDTPLPNGPNTIPAPKGISRLYICPKCGHEETGAEPLVSQRQALADYLNLTKDGVEPERAALAERWGWPVDEVAALVGFATQSRPDNSRADSQADAVAMLRQVVAAWKLPGSQVEDEMCLVVERAEQLIEDIDSHEAARIADADIEATGRQLSADIATAIANDYAGQASAIADALGDGSWRGWTDEQANEVERVLDYLRDRINGDPDDDTDTDTD